MNNNYNIRPLRPSDAPGMLEWMTDPEVNKFFRFDSSDASLKKCEKFIMSAADNKNTLHYAIVDENDEYLGTVSLKNIDKKLLEAEYAISTRSCAHGTGAAMCGTKEILKVAFNELGLKRVYLNVLADNSRANAFYKKAGFRFIYTELNAVEIRGQKCNLNWYEVTEETIDND